VWETYHLRKKFVFLAEMERQIRVEGTVSRAPEDVFDDYFVSRPRESRIGARVLPQSESNESSLCLERKFAKLAGYWETHQKNSGLRRKIKRADGLLPRFEFGSEFNFSIRRVRETVSRISRSNSCRMVCKPFICICPRVVDSVFHFSGKNRLQFIRINDPHPRR
jgi:hypothetical protein